MPTLQQLSAFVAVSRHGSVARAADALRITASPLSRTLRQLERTVGPLFERRYHEMQVNALGARLLPMAVSVVQQADDLETVARGEDLAIRFAATPWVPARFARALASAAEATGRAEDVDAAVSSRLLHRMAHGEIDIALVHLPADGADLDAVPLAHYRFHLAVAADDPLAGRAVVADGDLAGRRVLLLPNAMHPGSMNRLRDWFTSRGVASIGDVPLADVPSLGTRLRREHAVTIAAPDPETPILGAGDVVTIPFERNPVEMVLGIAWRCRDPLRQERLDAIVAALRPADGDLETIGAYRPEHGAGIK